MSSDRLNPLPPKPARFSPDDVLPHVEPPNVTFLLQLFLIPLLIVSMIVGVWFLFSWLASASADPQQIVREIEHRTNWQSAVTLASMLDNPDSRYVKVRQDPAFARQLGDVLRRKLETPLTRNKTDEERRQLCYVLCRALGNMETPAAIDPLLEAAALDRNSAEVDVRLGALEGLALLASRLGAETVRENEKLLPVLLDCSRASDQTETAVDGESSAYKPYGEIRGAAAFALGVVGGNEALDRLALMLDDAYPNARYNAATALARLGDVRAVPVLVEMLDPKNEVSTQDEKLESEREARRVQVVDNAIKAALQLAEKVPDDEAMEPIKRSLQVAADASFQSIESAPARNGLKLHAREALQRLQ